MEEDKAFFSRRSIIKGAGVTTGIGIIGGTSLLYSSQPAFAQDASPAISASALNIEANDEAVTEVTITPELSLEWAQFSSGISDFDITVSAGPAEGDLTEAIGLTGVSSSTTDVSSFNVDNEGALSDESGSASVTLSGIDLVSSGTLTTPGDLPSEVADGGEKSDDVFFDVTVTANNNNAGGIGGNSPSDTKGNSFTVSLTNNAGSTTVTGNVTSSGSTE